MKIKSLYKTYGDLVIFNREDFVLEEARINILVGPSGSGKTTLLRIILGLEDYEGDLGRLKDLKKSVVFQEDRLLEDERVKDNFFLVNPSLKEEDVRKILEEVDLGKIENKRVRELSGGMKRRIAILRALSVDYDLLILDEPFKGLDEKNYRIMKDYLFKKTKGKTILLSSHMKEDEDLLTGRLIRLD